MAKLWKRIKSWLIHKLGGFTDEDWPRTYYITGPCGKIKTLTAQMEFIYPHFPAPEWIEGKLLRMLAEGIKPYVTFAEEENPDRNRPSFVCTAEVKVVAGDG